MGKKNRWVVVATQSRPWVIAAGELVRNTAAGPVLRNARMCVYFDAPTGGLFGLARIGPQRGSRVSKPVDLVELSPAVAIMDATPEARAAWEHEPWA